MRTLVLLFLMISVAASGQITTKGEYNQKPTVISEGKNLGLEVSYIEEGDKDIYILSYLNAFYPSIREHESVAFYAAPEEVNTFYNDLDSIFDEPKDTEKRYTLGDSNLLVMNKGRQLNILVTGPGRIDSYFGITRKNLAKAFGKEL